MSRARRSPTTASRRRFVQGAAAALAAPMFIPASALGREGRPAPSERITLGSVGWGMMGPGNTRDFLNQPDCQVVAVCDLDAGPLRQALNTVNGHYGNEDCDAYHDYREMMARDDIDAVQLAVPDHWHALTSIEAANNGKDIYGEKPLAHTFREGRAIVDAVERNGRIWQTGSWQRSQFNFRRGCELVRNGRIGKVKYVEVGLPSGHNDFKGTGDQRQVTDPPEGLDYDFWVGPARFMPYIPAQHHMNWRWNYNFGGGQMMDWVGHHMDIAHWGLDLDHTGPVEVEAVEYELPPPHATWNTATSYTVVCKYEGGLEIVMKNAPSLGREGGADQGHFMGTKWVGEDGWVFVDRGKFETSPTELARERPGEDEVRLLESPGHHRNFLDSVKSREPTLTPAETAHRSMTPGILGHISMMVGRKVRWDPENEKLLDDPIAEGLLGREYRSPWSL